MNFLKLLILNFCPINMFRPILDQRLPHIYKYSMIQVFNQELDKDVKGYNQRFREIYEIPDSDDVFIFNYFRFEHYYNNNLKNKELSYSTLNKINKYGCVYRTKVPIYRGLSLFVGDQVLEHFYLYHTLIMIIVTNTSCLLSSLRVSTNKYLQFMFSSLMILVPHLLVMYLMDGIYLALALVLMFLFFVGKCLWKKPWKQEKEEPMQNGFVNYVNFTRGMLMVAIIITILAVDNIHFNQFLRKTFYDGFSAMDIGAGFFVTQTGASIALSRRKKNVWVILKKNIIILAIGLIRTVSTIMLGYDVDEREYGKHWNFFYTLVIARITVDLFNTYFHKYVVYALPFVITITYEVVLIMTKAIDKMPELPRSNFFYANREGFMSIPNSISGSLLILLVTKVALHYYRKGKLYKAFLTYAFSCATFFLIANVLYFANLKSARSLNNLRFLMYVMFLYNLGVASTVLFEIIYPRYRENEIIYACGKYPLMVYIVANPLCGFVNMVFKPYLLPLPYFLIILVIYSYIPILCGLFFNKMKWKAMSQWL